jgi:hypothetical protein
VTDEELGLALAEQESTRQPLGEIVVSRGYLSRPALLRTLAMQENRVLEVECGFGSGLLAVLDQRHETRRRLTRAMPAR